MPGPTPTFPRSWTFSGPAAIGRGKNQRLPECGIDVLCQLFGYLAHDGQHVGGAAIMMPHGSMLRGLRRVAGDPSQQSLIAK
jgi:hypothetical protein